MPVFDIAFVGTSLTAGTGTGVIDVDNAVNGGSWMPKLERALQVGKQSEVRTYNFGFPGQNSNYGLAQADRYVPFRAKLYVFEFCMNDSPGVQDVSMAQARENVLAMASLVQARTPDAMIALMTMNPVVGSSSGALARPNLPDYHENYRNYASEMEWLLIDNALSWGGVTTTEIPDGIHPLLAEVEARLIPDIVSVVGTLIP